MKRIFKFGNNFGELLIEPIWLYKLLMEEILYFLEAKI